RAGRGRRARCAPGQGGSRRIAGGGVPQGDAARRRQERAGVTGAVSASRAAWLLTRLRLRRQLNQMESIWRFRTGSSGRTGTGRTSSGLMILGALVAMSMLGSFTSLAYQSMANMQAELGSVVVPGPAAGAARDTPQPSAETRTPPPLLRPIAPEPGSVLARGVVQGATLAVMLLVVAALF